MSGLLHRIALRLRSERGDYIDWLAVPREYRFVAIDAKPTLGRDGQVVYAAGRPVAYSCPVSLVDCHWIAHELPEHRPMYLPLEAIIGPLPAPEHSLRCRPGRSA
jgi:hypothetical protein